MSCVLELLSCTSLSKPIATAMSFLLHTLGVASRLLASCLSDSVYPDVGLDPFAVSKPSFIFIPPFYVLKKPSPQPVWVTKWTSYKGQTLNWKSPFISIGQAPRNRILAKSFILIHICVMMSYKQLCIPRDVGMRNTAIPTRQQEQLMPGK